MAQTNASNTTKGRSESLIRADRTVSGIVAFFDRRVADAKLALIGAVNVLDIPDENGDTLADTGMMPSHPVVKLAVHGVTQNILDASNSLSGDDRVAFIGNACTDAQRGIWISAPVDEGKQREAAITAMLKLKINGQPLYTRAQAEKIVDGQANV